MISQKIWAKVGDILDIIQAFAPNRNALVNMYNAYSHPFAFINKYMKDFPSSTRQWAGDVYRAVRFHAKQGEVLPDQGRFLPLDRRLSGQIPLPEGKPGMAYGYRYNLSMNVDAKGVGQSHTFNFWVDSTGLLSESDVVQMTIKALHELLDRYKLTILPGQANSATVTSSAIQGFVQYIPGL